MFRAWDNKFVLCSFGISTKDEELDFPSLYWIPKIHKCPYKQCCIAGSAQCSTKPLFNLLTWSIPSAVKQPGFRVIVTLATQGVVWILWILKNSKDLLRVHEIKAPLSSCKSIKTFDSVQTIPNSNLKDILKELVQLCFFKKKANKDTTTIIFI